MQKLNFSYYFCALYFFLFFLYFVFLFYFLFCSLSLCIMPINHFCAFLTPWLSLGLKLSPVLQVCWMRHSYKVLSSLCLYEAFIFAFSVMATLLFPLMAMPHACLPTISQICCSLNLWGRGHICPLLHGGLRMLKGRDVHVSGIFFLFLYMLNYGIHACNS